MQPEGDDTITMELDLNAGTMPVPKNGVEHGRL